MYMTTWPGAGKGLPPLQGNVFALTWEGTGKALQAHGGVHVLVEILRSGFESF